MTTLLITLGLTSAVLTVLYSAGLLGRQHKEEDRG